MNNMQTANYCPNVLLMLLQSWTTHNNGCVCNKQWHTQMHTHTHKPAGTHLVTHTCTNLHTHPHTKWRAVWLHFFGLQITEWFALVSLTPPRAFMSSCLTQTHKDAHTQHHAIQEQYPFIQPEAFCNLCHPALQQLSRVFHLREVYELLSLALTHRASGSHQPDFSFILVAKISFSCSISR